MNNKMYYITIRWFIYLAIMKVNIIRNLLHQYNTYNTSRIQFYVLNVTGEWFKITNVVT